MPAKVIGHLPEWLGQDAGLVSEAGCPGTKPIRAQIADNWRQTLDSISQFDDDRFVYVRQFVKIGNQESWFYFAKNKKELQSNESILPREPNHLGGAIKKLEFTPEPVLVSLRHVRIDPPSPFLLNKWIFLRRQFMTIGKFSEVIGGYFCRVHVCFIAYVPHGTCTWSPCRHFSLLEIGSRIERWGEEKDY